MKGTVSTQPFVDDNAQGILIARRSRFPLNLFWRHVGDCSHYILRILVTRTLSDQGHTKITQQNFVFSPKQHVFWFYIAMDQLFVMRVLQGYCYLFHIGYNRGQRQNRAFWVALA